MRPARRLLQVLGLIALLGLALALLRLFLPGDYLAWLAVGWWVLLGMLAVAAALDALALRKRPLEVSRDLPGSFALGVANRVTVRLSNRAARAISLELTDHVPPQVKAEGLPHRLTIPAGESAELSYQAWPERRGDACFGDLDLRLGSPLGLWDFRQRVAAAQTVKVYPNFLAIARFEQLGHDQQTAQLGLHLLQRRGQGMDFHQLRDYRDGDVSRQIDWKASARRRKLISRDYQDERDQDIIFLLDCGRRMRARDEELSHFDHCLNSMLLMSYVALRQGDAVGFLSFAGEQRWLPPVKGKNNINRLLNSVYNLHSSTATSDLLEAASELLTKQRKRSLVVILSNLREEDRDDVLAATQLLSRNHLVLVASLREGFLDQVMETPVHDLDSSLAYCETTDLLALRRRLLQTLRRQGIVVTDSAPQQLHIQLVNEYWALKRSGRI